jgi:hypothetical protein
MFADRTFVTTPHPTLRWSSNSREGFDTGLDSTPYYFWSGGMVVDSLMGPAAPPAPGYWLEPTPYLAHGQCMPELLHTVADSVLLIAQASTGLLLAFNRSKEVDTLYWSFDRGTVTQGMVDGAQRLAESDLVSPDSRRPFLQRVGVSTPAENVADMAGENVAPVGWGRAEGVCVS